ncbi:hypothetical protein [Streptomyces apocyni]|uniref:hypothetical protein n=1 Tax=Streptomyces apocyni TaxID=2654677 RepID=UPI0012EA07EE|nr:hypothetical protein [Streptomyces apocyni]
MPNSELVMYRDRVKANREDEHLRDLYSAWLSARTCVRETQYLVGDVWAGSR